MESTAARRPPANDVGVCGMFINLFRRQRPALARLARNSNAYRQPMVASVSSSAVGVSSITSESNTATAAGVSTLDATIGRIHDIPQSAKSRLTGSPTVYTRKTPSRQRRQTPVSGVEMAGLRNSAR